MASPATRKSTQRTETPPPCESQLVTESYDPWTVQTGKSIDYRSSFNGNPSSPIPFRPEQSQLNKKPFLDQPDARNALQQWEDDFFDPNEIDGLPRHSQPLKQKLSPQELNEPARRPSRMVRPKARKAIEPQEASDDVKPKRPTRRKRKAPEALEKLDIYEDESDAYCPSDDSPPVPAKKTLRGKKPVPKKQRLPLAPKMSVKQSDELSEHSRAIYDMYDVPTDKPAPKMATKTAKNTAKKTATKGPVRLKTSPVVADHSASDLYEISPAVADRASATAKKSAVLATNVQLAARQPAKPKSTMGSKNSPISAALSSQLKKVAPPKNSPLAPARQSQIKSALPHTDSPISASQPSQIKSLLQPITSSGTKTASARRKPKQVKVTWAQQLSERVSEKKALKREQLAADEQSFDDQPQEVGSPAEVSVIESNSKPGPKARSTRAAKSTRVEVDNVIVTHEVAPQQTKSKKKATRESQSESPAEMAHSLPHATIDRVTSLPSPDFDQQDDTSPSVRVASAKRSEHGSQAVSDVVVISSDRSASTEITDEDEISLPPLAPPGKSPEVPPSQRQKPEAPPSQRQKPEAAPSQPCKPIQGSLPGSPYDDIVSRADGLRGSWELDKAGKKPEPMNQTTAQEFEAGSEDSPAAVLQYHAKKSNSKASKTKKEIRARGRSQATSTDEEVSLVVLEQLPVSQPAPESRPPQSAQAPVANHSSQHTSRHDSSNAPDRISHEQQSRLKTLEEQVTRLADMLQGQKSHQECSGEKAKGLREMSTHDQLQLSNLGQSRTRRLENACFTSAGRQHFNKSLQGEDQSGTIPLEDQNIVISSTNLPSRPHTIRYQGVEDAHIPLVSCDMRRANKEPQNDSHDSAYSQSKAQEALARFRQALSTHVTPKPTVRTPDQDKFEKVAENVNVLAPSALHENMHQVMTMFMQHLQTKVGVVKEVTSDYHRNGLKLVQKMVKTHEQEMVDAESRLKTYGQEFSSLCLQGCKELEKFQVDLHSIGFKGFSGINAPAANLSKLKEILAKME